MSIKSINHLPMSTTFIVEFESTREYGGALNKMKSWLSENCSGQWAVITSERTTIYAPNPHKSPIPGRHHQPSEIQLFNIVSISFENEEDATGFKLAFTPGA